MIAKAMETNEKKYNEQQRELEGYYNILKSNRAELYPDRIDETVQMSTPSGFSTGELNLDMV